MDLTLLFVGAVVSVLVQLIKNYAGTNKAGTLGFVLLLSLGAGAGSWYLQHAGLWESFMQVISGAGVMYAFFVKNFEDLKA